MKSLKLTLAIYLSLSILLVACKKDDSSTTVAPNSLRGVYSLSSKSNLEMLWWGSGGTEIAVTEFDRNQFLVNVEFFMETSTFNFISDSSLIMTDTKSLESDTIPYKIVDEIVIFDLRKFPLIGIDEYPYFKYTGNELYAYFYYAEFIDANGDNSSRIMHSPNNINIVDTLLNQNGYSSVANLKANEELI